MIAGDAFITPHAVRQFQARICRMPYKRALGVIIRGLESAASIKPTANGQGLCVRVRGQWNFRAIVKCQPGRKPVVVTILRSGK